MQNYIIDAKRDKYWMKRALELAARAGSDDEVPVGALIVLNDIEIAFGMNRREKWQSPIAHAEVIALHRAAKKLNSWRLLDCTLYVTLEPCVMCAGSLVQARVKRLVYGARDPKAGAVSSLYQICNDSRLNHKILISEGILATECGQILSDFFRLKRKKSKP